MRLKTLRRGRGVSVQALAVRIAITPKGLIDLENDRFAPRLATVEAIADALDIPLAVIFLPDDAPAGDRVQAVLADLPPSVVDFLATPGNADYLTLARDLAAQGLKPADVRALLIAALALRA